MALDTMVAKTESEVDELAQRVEKTTLEEFTNNGRPNIVVVGGSYTGCKTVDEIAPAFHETHNIYLIEKNTHFQHLFAFPRFNVYPGLEHRAFIPYADPFHLAPANSARVIHGSVLRVEKSKSSKPTQNGIVVLEDGRKIPWEYLVYATGTGQEGSKGVQKAEGCKKLQDIQEEVKNAKRIVIAGGGAFGIQVAFDIAEHLPEKEVTLVHSRPTVMNRFHPRLHKIVMDKFARVGVRTNLGSRLVVPPGGYPHDGRTFDIHLEDGTVLQAECIIQCTGAVALSKPLTYLAPELVDENSGYVKVRRTLQVADSRFPKIFSLGDVADTGAHKAARPAYMQVPIVRENVERIMKWEKENGREYTSEEEGKLDLQEYETPPAGIHLSLGFTESVLFRNPATPGEEPFVDIHSGEKTLEVGCWRIWANRAPTVTDFYS